MIRLGAAAAGLALAALPGLAAAACPSGGEGLAIRAEPVTVTPDALTGLRVEAAWELTAQHPAFGGFSGLLVGVEDQSAAEAPVVGEGRGFIAVSDRGALLGARYLPADAACPLRNAAFAPLTDASGAPLTGEAADAEGLAAAPPALLVSFERRHRIVALGPRALTRADRAFSRLSDNAGLEALAVVPAGLDGAGSVIAIAERPDADGFPVFVMRGGLAARAALEESRLVLPGPHLVTGADIGPDGRLYLLRRDYDPATGVSIVVEAMPLASLLIEGAPADVTMLARFGPESGIDNMEAIAAWAHEDGSARVTILSDDNFNPGQRTLLVELSLTE
ncbi:MAG: esterase-like activity of phytase family protein [Pseudomonadota bacterium]